ncbi:hypothetical protein BV20DRAFT_920104, partial [Pilatotrama ljubarskyi]
CDVPLVSLLPVCTTAGLPSPQTNQVDFPALMSIQHRALDEFLGQSSTGTELALNIRHAELTIRDLIVMVKMSNLTVKHVLSDTLAEFVVDAKSAARSLQRMSSKIQGAIDSITAFNAYALQEINTARGKGRRAHLDATLVRAFQASMEGFSSQISVLLMNVAATAQGLDRLDEHLSNASALCVQEAVVTTSAQDDLLWQLWTVLGGNRGQLRDLAHRSFLLKEVQQYRAVAVAYVAAAMQTLTGVDSDMTELRERLVASSIHEDGIPVEVHIQSIQRGLLRLK